MKDCVYRKALYCRQHNLFCLAVCMNLLSYWKKWSLIIAEDAFFDWFEATFKMFGRAILRPLRSKDVWGWILRLWPWNFWKFGCQPRKRKVDLYVPNESKVWLWYLSFCITEKGKSLRNNKKDKKIRTLEPFVIQRSALLFWGWPPNFHKWLQNLEVAASKFNIDCPLTSMASKTARANILKIASNQCKFSKD
jgi:hypothetical protein